MADKQIIKDFEINGKHVEVKVDYSLGGMNYFTYKQEKRGYYLHVQPYERTERNGYAMRTVVGFSGVKFFLLEVNRKSAKQLEKAVAMVTEEMIQNMLAQCKFN